jgi:hypothetical protein
MGHSFCTHTIARIARVLTSFGPKNLKKEDEGIDGRMGVWSGFIWLRIAISSEVL